MKKLVSYKLVLISVVLLSLLLTLTSCQSSKSNNENQIQPFDLSSYESANEYFITPQELKSGLDKGEILLFDCNKPDIYEKNHIPGAVSIGFHAFTDTSGQPGDPLWGTLVDKNELEKRLQTIGYDPNKTVVFYSDLFNGPGADGRAVWQLNLAGIKNAKILLGGSTYWKESGYELTKESSEPYPPFTGDIEISDYDKTMFTIKEDVYANLKSEPMLDVRTDKEFKGSQNVGEARGGHIQGAENMLWLDLLNKNGTLKSSDEIKNIMASYGIDKNTDATLYWTMGIRSGYTAMVLKAVGFENIKNYEASIYEWSNDQDMPMEK